MSDNNYRDCPFCGCRGVDSFYSDDTVVCEEGHRYPSLDFRDTEEHTESSSVNTLDVEVKILDERYKDGTFEMPSYANPGDAGLDLIYCGEDIVVLFSGESKVIGTGLSIFIKDPNVMGMIVPKSGRGSKEGLVLSNLVGIMDAPFQAEYMITAWNRNMDETVVYIRPGEKVAQLILVPILRAKLNIVEEFSEVTQRGLGGLGSTGISGTKKSREGG